MFRQALAIPTIVALLGLGGCSLWEQDTSRGPEKSVNTDLSGEEEVPPVETKGHGTAEVHYNTATRELSWDISYDDLSGDATAAHFHGPGRMGEAGAPVQIPLGDKGLGSPITGSTQLTEEQAKELLAGEWYVNIHTANHPDGEIRGQVIPEKEWFENPPEPAS